MQTTPPSPPGQGTPQVLLLNPNNTAPPPDSLNVVLATGDDTKPGYPPQPMLPPPPPAPPQPAYPPITTNGPWIGGYQGYNMGSYVLGPNLAFPGTETNQLSFVTLPVKEQQSTDPQYQGLNNGKSCSLRYTYPAQGQQPNPDFNSLNHTIVLQRLANPYLPPQPDATPATIQQKGYFNPYVTVDYMVKVPIYDAVKVDSKGPHTPQPAQGESNQNCSYGRNQPYAADISQQTPQTTPPPANLGTPTNTFFSMNQAGQNTRFDWLPFANRQLASPMELLFVSSFKPSELTQQFVTAQGKFQHIAPWFNQQTVIYRLFEFLEGTLRPQWSPVGGRFPGRINLNTLWDQDVFNCLCDAQPDNFFQQAGVQACFQNMLLSRTPGGTPGFGLQTGKPDRPFLGMAAPYASGAQYPNGVGINDTFLRVDPTNPNKHLFQPDPNPNLNPLQLNQGAMDQPYWQLDMMHKIFQNTTTRSNVFAVWLTVGFFEADDSVQPPRLGAEIGLAQNKQVRHRMFAVLDRTNLTVAANAAGQQTVPGGPPIQQLVPGQVGPVPFFIDAQSAAQGTGQPETISVLTMGGNYEQQTWSIAQGSYLVVGAGYDQEIVQVLGVGANSFQAIFQLPHPKGFSISGAVQNNPVPGNLPLVPILGNPGPQPRFDMHNPNYRGVVRYFSLIE